MQRLCQWRNPRSLTCLATGTTASALLVRVNQCNGSGNGGGSLVACTANIVNNVIAGPASSTSRPTIPPTDTAETIDSAPPGSVDLVVAGVVLAGLLAFVLAYRRLYRQPGPEDAAP